MPDREKVIKGLEICKSPHGRCAECPYEDDELNFTNCTSALCGDALALLKEQETKLICNLLGGEPYEVYCKECRMVICRLGKGDDMNTVKGIFTHCPNCGRLVK